MYQAWYYSVARSIPSALTNLDYTIAGVQRLSDVWGYYKAYPWLIEALLIISCQSGVIYGPNAVRKKSSQPLALPIFNASSNYSIKIFLLYIHEKKFWANIWGYKDRTAVQMGEAEMNKP